MYNRLDKPVSLFGTSICYLLSTTGILTIQGTQPYIQELTYASSFIDMTQLNVALFHTTEICRKLAEQKIKPCVSACFNIQRTWILVLALSLFQINRHWVILFPHLGAVGIRFTKS